MVFCSVNVLWFILALGHSFCGPSKEVAFIPKEFVAPVDNSKSLWSVNEDTVFQSQT